MGPRRHVPGKWQSVDELHREPGLAGIRHARIDAGLARLVEMRFFGGMTEEEIAEALSVSPRTVSREWKKARALLLTLVEG